MGKEEFVSILSRKGYISKIENGVVIVYAHNISNDKEMKAFLTEVKNLVKETGYGGSYGVKCKIQKRLPWKLQRQKKHAKIWKKMKWRQQPKTNLVS